MSMSVSSALPVLRPSTVPSARTASPALLRCALLVACAVALAAAAMLGDPARLVQADPQLAFLLRGMALIKSALVLAAIALLLWRFAHPVSNGFALAYIAGTAVLAAASMLIWQLSFIPLAALAFHVAALAVLLAAWRDDGSGLGNLRRARQPARSLAPQEKPATACGT